MPEKDQIIETVISGRPAKFNASEGTVTVCPFGFDAVHCGFYISNGLMVLGSCRAIELDRAQRISASGAVHPFCQK